MGSVVEFPNHDPFFHNVFSLFEGKRFDLGLVRSWQHARRAFRQAGRSYIFCNIHPEMSAVVVALDTPYYGISDRRGELVIAKIPSGSYTLQIWYESALPETLKTMSRDVTVSKPTPLWECFAWPKPMSPPTRTYTGATTTRRPRTAPLTSGLERAADLTIK